MTLHAWLLMALHVAAPGLSTAAAREWADDLTAAAPVAADGMTLLDVYAAGIATVSGESSFLPAVQKCLALGNAGEITAWQLTPGAMRGHTARQVCDSPKLAARLGFARLSLVKHGEPDWRGAVCRYIGANVPEDDPRCKKRLRVFDAVMALEIE